METVEHLIIGGGPAGLRAGQVLAEAGREVLVAEKGAEIGPQTCAGGLTPKSVPLLRRLGLCGSSHFAWSATPPFEGGTLEVDFRGLHFGGGAHLAGDAAGAPSALTAQGIYSALATGEEVARGIVEPAWPSPRLRRWLRTKRRHDRFATLPRRPSGRAVALPMLDRLSSWRAAQRPMAEWFLAG